MEENTPIVCEAEVPVKKSAKVMGIISMILGILSLCTFYSGNILLPIAGLILAKVAKKNGEAKFSKTGKTTSVIALILTIVAWVLVIAVGILGYMWEKIF